MIQIIKNKAVYTTASVEYGSAGAVMQGKFLQTNFMLSKEEIEFRFSQKMRSRQIIGDEY